MATLGLIPEAIHKYPQVSKKKRKLNEELKMKRMQERSDKQKKKNEESASTLKKAQAKIHKCD